MKSIPLNKGKFALVDDEDYEYLMQWKWYENKGYAVRGINIGGKIHKILMHRVINKTPLGMDTDHINLNKLDNQKSNPRTATSSQNQMNKGMQKNNTSGIRGVSFHKRVNKWAANMGIHGKAVHLGYFDTKELAEKAHRKVAKFLFGDFSYGQRDKAGVS